MRQVDIVAAVTLVLAVLLILSSPQLSGSLCSGADAPALRALIPSGLGDALDARCTASAPTAHVAIATSGDGAGSRSEPRSAAHELTEPTRQVVSICTERLLDAVAGAISVRVRALAPGG